MGVTTDISWCDSTWNPWQGCKKVSAGCKNCYMFRDMKRYGKDGSKVFRSAKATFNLPLSGKIESGARIFTCSWSDFFIKDADAWRAEAWEIIKKTPQYFYIILTKRPENIASRLPADWGPNGYPNVGLLISAENQAAYSERWPILSDIPAALRGISAEPLLSPFSFREGIGMGVKIPDWIITGGESGPGCRVMAPDDFALMGSRIRTMRIPHFHKQNGGTKKVDGSWGGDTIRGMTFKTVPKVIADHMKKWKGK